jgi:anthranilate/para-aminobenzoate synthase component I
MWKAIEKFNFFTCDSSSVQSYRDLHENANNNAGCSPFPAGTLSGAPKHRAMQLKSMKKTNRNFYGGVIGFMDFEGNFNHAIMIRTFLSKTINCTRKQVQEL